MKIEKIQIFQLQCNVFFYFSKRLLKISFLETIYNSTVMKKMKMHLVARKVQIWRSNFHIVQINFFSSWLRYHFGKMNIRIISMLNLENINIMQLN